MDLQGCHLWRNIIRKKHFRHAEEDGSPDGIYKSLPIDIGLQKEGFRYLKIKFDNVFQLVDESSNTTNLKTRYLSFHELEVFSEKEE